MSRYIKTTLEDRILTVTLARADKKNAIDNGMYQAMAEALERAETDPAVHAVLFRAEGKDFTAGNDMTDFAAVANGTFEGEWYATRFLTALARATCPIVAAAQGHAVGIGTTMLLHCDLVVIADDVQLAAPFINLALVPEAASSMLVPARIGHARAYALFALGQTIDAPAALALGIANQLVSAAALAVTALELAHQLARRPSGALRAMKRLMRDPAVLLAAIDAENAAFLERLDSAEAREARAAFAAHRTPDFTRRLPERKYMNDPTPSGCDAGLLYVLDLSGGHILTVNPDGSDRKVIVSDCRLPDGIAIDRDAGHIYWTNMGVPNLNDGAIERADLDGKNRRTIVPHGGTFTPKQLQLDKRNGKLYWCDREGMRVMRASLDGSEVETLVETGRGDDDRRDQKRWCVGICVDVDAGQMYWSQKGADDSGEGRIFRAPMALPMGQDPAARGDIELLFDGLPEPIDLELDPRRRMLYWTDRGDPPRGNTVSRAPLDAPADGRAAPEIVLTHLMEGIGIALDVDGDRMFMTDLGGSLYSARLDGGDRKTLLYAQGNLTGVAYVEPATSVQR